MKLEMDKDKIKKALDSNCSICGQKIMPYQIFKASETIRGSLVFVHDKCLYPQKYNITKEGLKR